jgi:hypothetical protein
VSACAVQQANQHVHAGRPVRPGIQGRRPPRPAESIHPDSRSWSPGRAARTPSGRLCGGRAHQRPCLDVHPGRLPVHPQGCPLTLASRPTGASMEDGLSGQYPLAVRKCRPGQDERPRAITQRRLRSAAARPDQHHRASVWTDKRGAAATTARSAEQLIGAGGIWSSTQNARLRHDVAPVVASERRLWMSEEQDPGTPQRPERVTESLRELPKGLLRGLVRCRGAAASASGRGPVCCHSSLGFASRKPAPDEE